MSVNKYQADQVRCFLELGMSIDDALAQMATPDSDPTDEVILRDHYANHSKEELINELVEADQENRDQSVYRTFVSNEQDAILEELRSKLAQVAGVTLTGNRLTVRWNRGDDLVQVHAVILEVG